MVEKMKFGDWFFEFWGPKNRFLGPQTGGLGVQNRLFGGPKTGSQGVRARDPQKPPSGGGGFGGPAPRTPGNRPPDPPYRGCPEAGFRNPVFR